MTKELIYCFHCATEGHEAEDCWVGKRTADLTKPKRPWVGLTAADSMEFATAQLDKENLMYAVEDKLKEKNT